MKRSFQAIVVGGGHNGLVCASYLAKQGKRVAVFESRKVLGGASVTEELIPGYKFSRGAYLGGLLRPTIIKELKLDQYGLEFFPRQHSSFTPLLNEDYLLMGQCPKFNVKEIEKFSKKDASNYPKYEKQLKRFAVILEDLLDCIPPDPASPTFTKPKDLVEHIKTGVGLVKNIKNLGNKSEIGTFLQFLLTPASKWLDLWFESEPLKATLATDAVIGAHISPHTPGSGYVLLHHVMGEWAYVKGGMGMISYSIACAAKDLGVEIFTDAEVCNINVVNSNNNNGNYNGSVSSITLSSGETIETDIIISNATPFKTFSTHNGDDNNDTKNNINNGLLSIETCEKYLSPEFYKNIADINYKSSTTKINLATNALPNFRCTPSSSNNKAGIEHEGTIHIGCESMESLHNAYQDAEYKNIVSKTPLIEMTIPSVLDNTLAPEGHHVINLFCQYTPYQPKDGEWNEESKRKLAKHIFRLIDDYAPNFSKSIIGEPDILTPKDLEVTFGLTGGNIFHGEMTLDRLFITRPVASGASYRVPGIKGLYLCGASTHPGGGVMGAAGRNCSRAVLNDL